MTWEEILRGESKNVEFKEVLPNHSENYLKTVVAFANTQGGCLVFGVADGTREVVGISEEILFQVMDSIANAISDSCEPQIILSIEPHTVEGKSVILVAVSPSPHRPYYMRSKGKERGTYIRVAATTRLAEPEKVKELEMEGAKVSWDELVCIGYKVTDKAVKKLCRDMNARRKDMQERQSLSQKLPAVTGRNLENWNVLKKVNGEYVASNAFVLLTSNYFPFSKTQCAVFKGIDRNVFLDKREYTGPLYEQIDDAVDFVLRNIRLGARIEGIQRKEDYELPVGAIREMIINAHCHRNMTDESCIQVAIYDNRLEVTSPGGLYNGLTLDEAMNGRSRLRNRAIANIFSQIGLVEAWGTGLRRIQDVAREYGLPDPEFIEMPDAFRINLFRKQRTTDSWNSHVGEHIGESGKYIEEKDLYAENIDGYVREDVGEKHKYVGENDKYVGDAIDFVGENYAHVGDSIESVRENSGDYMGNVGEKHRYAGDIVGDVGNVGENLAENDGLKKVVLEIVSGDNRISAAGIARRISVTQRTVERYIKALREEGRLVRHGSARGGYWEVVKVGE